MQRLLLTSGVVLLLLLIPWVGWAQKAVFLVRHAEKVDESADAVLSKAGEARAEALRHILADAGVSAIFTSERARTRQTALPLARALGLEPTMVPAGAIDLLVEKIRARVEGVVLVVAHSDTLPGILAGLGVENPPSIARTEYDNLFIVVPPPKKRGASSLLRLRF